MKESIDKIVDTITDLFLTPIIYLLVSLSILYFFWGLALFILNGEEQSKREEGRAHMLWGIVGLVIIGSVWGILNFIDATITSVV